MADPNVNPDGPSLEPRVAVLEQIAVQTRGVLERLDHRMDRLEDRMQTQFFWLLALYIGGMGAIIGGGGVLLVRVAAKVGAL
jgi:hypothetical protein